MGGGRGEGGGWMCVCVIEDRFLWSRKYHLTLQLGPILKTKYQLRPENNRLIEADKSKEKVAHTVYEGLPVNEEMWVQPPGPGRFHMPRSN